MEFDLYTIARVTRGEVCRGEVVYAPAPGHSERDRSMAIKIAPDCSGGLFVWLFSKGCPLLAKDKVLRLMDLPPASIGGRRSSTALAPGASPPSRELSAEDRKRVDQAKRLWDEAIDPQGTPVEPYLRSRGLALPAAGDTVVRYHPKCPFGRGRRTPAMLALVRDVEDDYLRGIHRTALSLEGIKVEIDGVDRRSMGPIANGAIKLGSRAEAGGRLGIAEGIETALSLQCIPEFGAAPVWSLVSAGGIARLPVLPGVTQLWIAVDNDQAGRAAAKACVERWRDVEVVLVRPRRREADLNDLMRGRPDAA
ncbi:DUF7146 domain-containing protein [Methylobacterium nonmethylotrophicum]|uniref:Uncharacterized protein n=1 Tax=Methylobacterium nonmethylotrophicum TaxID=1141884 RepID=A0A4Z0NFZ9_9HYPH|nr:toprim domain-containing protein [Methylobacterium nonmethylotrophicum]TGD94582.1 hypothetical protein EU555_32025 [Methylobacterium nonmethylotrophicum]